MKKLIVAAVFAVLAACSQQSGIDLTQDTAVGIQRNLSAGDIQKLKDTCTASAQLLTTATSATAPAAVKDTAIYPYTFCYQLLTNQQNNADQSSLTWLPQVLQVVQTAAQVAGYVLPMILPLL